MPSYVPPKKNIAHIFYVSLVSQSDTKIMQANPTLAAGDVKVAVDDAAPANMATLPVVDGDFTKRVKVALSTSEMNGDNITIIFSDAAGAEWCDLTINLQTTAAQIDDLALAATALTDVTWTDAKAGYLDGAISGRAPASEYDTEMARITANVALASVCTEARLGELAAANLPTDIDLLLTRITAAVALASVCTETRLAELDAANLAADIDTLLTRITALIATKAEMDTAHALLATPAQVNTQVLDVLNTDTFGEPGQGAPPTPTTIINKIGYMYKFLRNKVTNDGTDIEVYNDAGAVVDQKSPVSAAGGTVTRGEFISGP